jgi:hypothetical protein
MTAGSDSVRPPLQLPKTVAELALRLSRRELTLVERGMAVHAAARKPQPTGMTSRSTARSVPTTSSN